MGLHSAFNNNDDAVIRPETFKVYKIGMRMNVICVAHDPIMPLQSPC